MSPALVRRERTSHRRLVAGLAWVGILLLALGGPGVGAADEAISREWSLFVPVSDAPAPEAISRELSLLVPETGTGAGADAVSREYSFFLPDPRPVPGNLVAWWPGEAPLTDLVAGRQAEPRGGAAVGPALVGQGFFLDGVDDVVELPVRAPFEAFTVAFWLRPDPVAKPDAVVVSNRPGNGHGWEVRRDGSQPASYLFVTALESWESRARFGLEPGIWQFVVVTRNASHECQVFVDGVRRAVSADGGPMRIEGEEPVRLGGGGGEGGAWGGVVDEWMLFDRAFEAGEVVGLFAAGASGFDRRLPADLTVAGVSGPTSALAGQPIAVEWSVGNRASYAAPGPRRDRVFLRRDGAADRVLADFEDPSTIPGGATRRYTATVILPPDLAGIWHLAVSADVEDHVFEGDGEGDNTGVGQAGFAVSVPDLAIGRWTVPAAPLVAGTAFEVEWEVANGGSVEARGPWWDGVFLASTPDGDPAAARRLQLSGPLGPLAAGGAYARRATLVLPLTVDIPPGDYHLVIAANADASQPESTGANNRASRPVLVVRPPLPDLVIVGLNAPAEWEGGKSVPASLVVSNAGMAEVTAGWMAGVRLARGPGAGTAAGPPLAEVALPAGLPPGRALTVQVTVPIPATSPAGPGRLVAEVDGRGEVFESDETNNSAEVAGLVPLALRWRPAGAGIAEEGTPFEVWLERNGDLSEVLEVALTADVPSQVDLPERARFAAGAGRTDVVLVPRRDGIVEGSRTLSLLAQAAGYPEAGFSVVVRDGDVPALSLVPSVNAVREGETIPVIVGRTGPVEAPVRVILGSPAPSQFVLPDPVVLASGERQTTVSILAADDSLLEASSGYRLTASASGYQTAEATLEIEDDDLPLLDLEIRPVTIGEGAGPQAGIILVRRDRAAPRALTVRLDADRPGVLRVPPSVVLPAFATTVSVPFGAVDDPDLDGSQGVVVSAVALLTGTGEPIGAVVSRAITVTDDDGPALGLSLARSAVREGGVVTGTVRRNTGSAGELRVALAVSDSREATVPSTVVLPDGRSTLEFAVTSLVDAGPDGSKPVVVEATADGYAGAEATLVVTDADLPDVVPTSVSGPATAWTGDQPLLSFAVANRGVVPFGARITQRLFLSRDPLVGDDLLIGTYDLQPGPGGFPPESAPVGQTIKSPYAFPEAGDYWVIVAADANGAVEELDEANNTRISDAPIRVAPEFTAIVRVDLTDKVRPAGTDIPLVGSITGAAGRPLAGKRVDLHLTVREFHRVISAITDANGAFRTVFRPLPGEAGHYSVGAARAGEPDAAVQDEFTLLGAAFDPARLSASLTETATETRRVTLRNASEIPLFGLRAEVVGEVAEGLAIGAEVTAATLPGLGTVEVVCSLTAGPIEALPGEVGSQPRRFSGAVRVTTAQGTTHDLPLEVVVEPLRPRLRVEPAELVAGMVRGGQRVVEFAVINDGRAESGPLTVSLPEAPWLRLVTTNPVPSIVPGGSNSVSLLLAPDVNLPFGTYEGRLVLESAVSGLAVPFSFRAVGEAQGDLRVTAVDEFTYYAEGAPRVAGARVIVRETGAGSGEWNGTTDAGGEHTFAGLPEGYYEVEVSAGDHGTWRGTVLVEPGRVTEASAFVPRELVRYTWRVEPTEVEDRTRLVVESTFETAVPAPVVTVEPAVIDLEEIRGSDAVIELVIENHGLIAAQGMRLEFPHHPAWVFKPLVTELGDLPARGSLRVPILIERLRSGFVPARTQNGGPVGDRPPGPCHMLARACWTLICGAAEYSYCGSVQVRNANRDCSGSSGSAGGAGGAGAGTDSGSGQSSPASIVREHHVVTLPCCAGVAASAASCLKRFAEPYDCPIGAGECANSFGPGATSIWDVMDQSVNCFGAVYDCFPGEEFDPMGEALLCLTGIANAVLRCWFQGDRSIYTSGSWAARRLASNPDPGDLASLAAEVLERVEDVRPSLALFEYVTGSGGDRFRFSERGARAYMSAIRSPASMAGDEGRRISDREVSDLLSLPALGGHVDAVSHAIGRWNRTVEYWEVGITSDAGLASEADRDFMAVEELARRLSAVRAAYDRSQGMGFATPWGAARFFTTALVEALPAPGDSIAAHGMAPGLPVPLSGQGHLPPKMLSVPPISTGAICARVGLRLEQEAVLTRSAFRATLELENRDGNPLRDVRVDLRFRTLDAIDATERFGVRAPVLDGITGVDGSGAIAPLSAGSAEWTLIPGLDAALAGPTTYLVGGTLAYTQDGTRVTVPLADVPITVHPGPELVVDYFHQRDVLADDPFTATVEPSIPYALGIMVRNVGRGEARNFRITSGQPRIVDNEKGLLIDFRLIGTEVDGRNLSPSLTADFGNIGVGTNAIGRWLFTSTLQGLFVDYRASFEHLDAIAGRRLSIITNVAIHEMIRSVRAPGAADDGRTDFLLNEDPDLEDLADTVWLSDGTRRPVELIGAARVSGAVPPGGGEVAVTFVAPGGYSYLRIPDPAGAAGDLPVRLVGVRRPGGSPLPAGNFWQSDRTFVGRGRRPVRENLVHVFDLEAAGSYTLVYQATAAPDTVAPTSRVRELAASVGPVFPVQWDGTDDRGGPLSYDLWVSEDGGPFVPWLRDVGADSRLFEGRTGRAYAFYSVARDAAGNREAPPTTPDAWTVTGHQNRAPVIAPLADRALVEGETLAVSVVVTDPDGDPWTLRVVEGPVGLALDDTGVLRWATGPATGPGSRRITLEARDSGLPTASSRMSFLVAVQDFDAAPVAAQDVVERLRGKRVRVAESQLLANDVDPDGRPLTLVSVSDSGLNGGRVSRAEGWITYVPPPGLEVPDQFTYTVSDGAREATGVVLVLVPDGDDQATLNLVAARALERGGIRLTVAGIPGHRYEVQVATSVTDPVWVPVGGATADAVGRFDFEDPAPPQPLAFYRAVEAAAPGVPQNGPAAGSESEPRPPFAQEPQ